MNIESPLRNRVCLPRAVAENDWKAFENLQNCRCGCGNDSQGPAPHGTPSVERRESIRPFIHRWVTSFFYAPTREASPPAPFSYVNRGFEPFVHFCPALRGQLLRYCIPCVWSGTRSGHNNTTAIAFCLGLRSPLQDPLLNAVAASPSSVGPTTGGKAPAFPLKTTKRVEILSSLRFKQVEWSREASLVPEASVLIASSEPFSERSSRRGI